MGGATPSLTSALFNCSQARNPSGPHSASSVLFEEAEAGAAVLAKDRRPAKNQDGDWFSNTTIRLIAAT